MGKAVSALRSQEVMVERAKKFVEKASRVVKVVEAYIVGSRARGDYLDESDIDVLIVADGVDHLNMLERLKLLTDIAEPGVDYLVYSIREWNDEETLWIRNLKREAIKIYPSSREVPNI